MTDDDWGDAVFAIRFSRGGGLSLGRGMTRECTTDIEEKYTELEPCYYKIMLMTTKN